MPWHSMFGDIARGCNDEPADTSDPPRNQRRIRQKGDPHPGVETVADQVDGCVAQMQIHCDFRIELEEFRQDRRDPAQAKGHRHGKADEPARLGGEFPGCGLSLFGFQEYAREPAAPASRPMMSAPIAVRSG